MLAGRTREVHRRRNREVGQGGEIRRHQTRLTRADMELSAPGGSLPRAGARHAKGGMETLSMPVITHFLAGGQFIAAMPKSVVHFNSLKVLPVDFPARPWPVNVVTLRNRTLSPVVARFIECAREVAKSIPGRQAGHSACRRKPSVRGRDEG